jgi:small GTP-binding protein
MNNKPSYTHKLVFLGESCVGKSSIVSRHIRNTFTDDKCSTIGASFFTSKIELYDCTIRFDIWDTAGQERYHSLAPLYYRNASVIFVVFDVTSNSSFAQAKSWVNELKKMGPENAIILLIGNKIDMLDLIKVKPDIINEFAESNNIKYIETSAKTNHNIEYMFRNTANDLYKQQKIKITNNDNLCKIDNKENRMNCCYIA